MLQAPVFDGLSFDPFSLQQDGLAAPKIDVGGGEVVQALVVAPVMVVLDEGLDVGLKRTRQIVVFCPPSTPSHEPHLPKQIA